MIDFDTLLTQDVKQQLAKIKFDLLVEGILLSDETRRWLLDAKRPIRTRSGASSGLDLILPYDVHVNVPVNETFTSKSKFTLEYVDGQLSISSHLSPVVAIKLQPSPAYYSKKTADGSTDMVKIGQMCSGDRFCYGMTGPSCYFWAPSRRCKFCSIGLNKDDAIQKRVDHFLEVLHEAINDPNLPAKHVLLGGGTPHGEDMGAVLASELCIQVKKRYDISVYVMIVAPLKNDYLDMLYDAGVDELGMNLEFWSDDAWQEYIPGKRDVVGKKQYIKRLEYAVQKFGPINTRSILVCGLEDKDQTYEGAITLASMGVMPILSPFRALNGTMLQEKLGFDGGAYYDLYYEVESEIKKRNTSVPVGPTCIPCQNNVLALPFGSEYKYY